jgi:hypothetical protein
VARALRQACAQRRDSELACDRHVIPTRPSVARVGDFTVDSKLVLQADPELAIGFVDGADRVDPVPTEIMRCMLEMVLRAGKRAKRSVDLRVISPSWGW